MIYGKRTNGNFHGLVLTKPSVVEIMLDRVNYVESKNLRNIRVVEPSAGEGVFCLTIIERLYKSSQNFNFSFQEALNNLHFYEIDKSLATRLTQQIISLLKKYSAQIPDNMIKVSDFLISDVPKSNLIIGNPPYVRHENIPEEKKFIYRKTFKTFNHRSDLYIAFYEKGLNALEPGGTLSFICSNRWLKNQYGITLREYIKQSFHLEEIIDLEDTNPFEESVIAYPAITTIKKLRSFDRTKYYKIDNLTQLSAIGKSIEPDKTLNTHNSNNWFLFNFKGETYEKYLDTIENQGFKIGIGVATGADKVFIRKDFKKFIEDELLIPILTSKDLKNNSFHWSGNYILNPFDQFGRLINLELYPKAKEYFYSQKEILLKRHISKKNSNNWYRTIDKIKPEITSMNKILLPDISGNRYLFIDKGKYYPHHNLYYITGKDYDKLILLAAILMSDFVIKQISEIGNKMNGGYPRWQSQNLKKVVVPVIDSIPDNIRLLLFRAYHNKNYSLINELIRKEEISKFNITIGQTKLFEPQKEYIF